MGAREMLGSFFRRLQYQLFRYWRWRAEAPRRYLTRTLYNDMIGFPDSDLDVGEEQVAPFEEEYTRRILEILERRHQRDYPAGVRPMLRDFHGKAHACVRARFEVETDLPSEVRYGVFVPGAQYDAVIRFSNAARDLGSDKLPNNRGMAIKLVVEPGGWHQDFLLADYPVNMARDAEAAYHFYRAEAARRPLAYMIRSRVSFAIAMLSSIFQQSRDLLDLTYYSQTPYKLGPRGACKYITRPLDDAGHKPLSEEELRLRGPDYLRERMEERLRLATPGAPIRFGFFIQPQRHPQRQPVEDATLEWDQAEAVPIRVATVTLTPELGLPITSPESRSHGEVLAFDPAHAHPDLRPIGGLNRVRVAVYARLARMRFDANGTDESTGRAALPS